MNYYYFYHHHRGRNHYEFLSYRPKLSLIALAVSTSHVTGAMKDGAHMRCWFVLESFMDL